MGRTPEIPQCGQPEEPQQEQVPYGGGLNAPEPEPPRPRPPISEAGKALIRRRKVYIESRREPFQPGKSAHELISDLPPDAVATRALAPLTDEGFFTSYSELSEIDKETVHLILKRVRTELIAREKADYGVEPESFFRQFRTDARLDLTATQSAGLSDEGARLRGQYADNIREYGDQGIAHLCVNHRIFNKLKRAGLLSITAVEQVIRSGQNIGYLRSNEREKVAEALRDWQLEREQVNARRDPSYE